MEFGSKFVYQYEGDSEEETVSDTELDNEPGTA